MLLYSAVSNQSAFWFILTQTRLLWRTLSYTQLLGEDYSLVVVVIVVVVAATKRP